MKKVLSWLVIASLWISGVFAYTQSVELDAKLEVIAERLDDMVDANGEEYRTKLLTALYQYLVNYSSNEQASYIITYLVDHLEEWVATDTINTSTTVDWDYRGEYTINDSTYGTQVEVTISNDVRTIVANALPDHETGEFPREWNPNTISAQDTTYTLDYTPTYTWDASWARESWVAYNGVKFELETAERVVCETGETYKIEAIQDMVNLGLDFNNAHVQPTGAYHYHGISATLVESLEGDDIVHVWYANDGFPIYYSKEWTYAPSFALSSQEREWTDCSYRNSDVIIDGTDTDGTYVSDWEYDASLWDLDSCNGIELNGEYVYFMTDTFPYGPRCFNGETVSGQGWQGAPQWSWESRPEWNDRIWPPQRR